jgi:hypothetical protein
MPNRNYLRGRAHEYAIKRKWERDGWTVLRTAGSHGFADLVALRARPLGRLKSGLPYFVTDRSPPASAWEQFDGEIVFIQAKSGKSARTEREKLESLKAKWGGTYSVRVELL